jgi:hypothetical protein
MSDLDELIESANRLCNNLDRAAENEKKFCQDICLQLERYSWDVYRMANNFKEIRESFGSAT